MSEICPVVLIRTPGGPARLNESDFDKAKHVLWDDKPKPVHAAAPPRAPVEQAKEPAKKGPPE